MKRIVQALFGVALSGLLLVGLYWAISASDRKGHVISRQVQWQLTVINQTDQVLRDVEVFSFIPHANTWRQAMKELTASHPVVVDTAAAAQPTGRVVLPTIPPYGQRDIRFVAQLDMANHEDKPGSAELDNLLHPDPMIESDHQAIRELAERLERPITYQSAHAIHQWLTAEIEDAGYDPVDRGALHAIHRRQGDCSEFAALAVALARALGIPARLVNGYVVAESSQLSPYEYHAWAELYIDDRWLILDAQRREFDAAPKHYVSTHYGTSGSRQVNWTRFHSPDSRVAIEMQ